MAKSRKLVSKTNLLWIVLGFLGLLGLYVLWVPNIVVDANTPAWLNDQITYATNIRDGFNVSGFTYLVIIIALGLLFMLNSYLKNKQNKTVLGYMLVAAVAFSLYLLVTPALASAFSDQQWLVDFSQVATDVTQFISDNNGFLTILFGALGVTYIALKKK